MNALLPALNSPTTTRRKSSSSCRTESASVAASGPVAGTDASSTCRSGRSRRAAISCQSLSSLRTRSGNAHLGSQSSRLLSLSVGSGRLRPQAPAGARRVQRAAPGTVNRRIQAPLAILRCPVSAPASSYLQIATGSLAVATVLSFTRPPTERSTPIRLRDGDGYPARPSRGTHGILRMRASTASFRTGFTMTRNVRGRLLSVTSPIHSPSLGSR